jgi:hypothetical protein
MKKDSLMICWKCGKEVELEKKPARNDVCPKCGAYLRCCYNCNFYDAGAHNQCRESSAEWVGDKEKANFCEYFVVSAKGFSKEKKSSRDEGKKKWDDPFKD